MLSEHIKMRSHNVTTGVLNIVAETIRGNTSSELEKRRAFKALYSDSTRSKIDPLIRAFLSRDKSNEELEAICRRAMEEEGHYP